MKKQTKVLLAVSAMTVVLVTIAAFSLIVAYSNQGDFSGQIVAGWGDSGGGRSSYTIDEINKGVLGDKIIFNTISDGTLGNEKNFVSARPEDDPNGYQGNEIVVEDGKEYIVRLYVHNNSLYSEDSIAENVRVAFSVPWGPAKNIPINGFIFSDNATPDTYWDGIVLTADQNFHLEYIEGSAKIENNGFASKENGGAKALSDDIVTSPEGVLIGYNDLDGKIPGCFQYDCVVTIRVKVVYETGYMVECKARLEGEKEWSYNIEAKVDDRIEYQIQYKNVNDKGKTQNNVFVRDILPENLRYIEGSTVLYNADHEAGMILDTESDDLTTDGINIGNYGAGANAYIRFTVEVVDESLEPGSNALVNWAKGTVDDTALSDYAVVMVNKE